MADVTGLRAPPIQEAVMDFQMAGCTADLTLLSGIAEELSAEGWTKKNITTYEVEAEFGEAEGEDMSDGVAVKSSSTSQGFVIADPSNRLMIQLRSDRVTVSHVGRYESWEDLEADAMRALKAHVAASSAKAVTRIGVRFINRLRLPTEEAMEFDQFLTRPPLMPNGLSDGVITDFLNRKVIKGLEGDLIANLTVGTALPFPGEPTHSLVVDIDISRTCDLLPSVEVLQPQVRGMRHVKNQLFFDSVTNKALETYR